MPRVSDLKNSRFLKKEDVEPPKLATIESYEEMNVALEGDKPDMRFVLHFKELDKPLVLNITNGQAIQAITGNDDLDSFIGVRVVLYNDPNVSYAGKRTGGIRIRPPKQQAAQKQNQQRSLPKDQIPDPDPSIQEDDDDNTCIDPETGKRIPF